MTLFNETKETSICSNKEQLESTPEREENISMIVHQIKRREKID